MAADSPSSPLGREARALSDEAWARARAHELTEEQLQGVIGHLRDLAAREPDESERESIEAQVYVLADLFQLVEDEEADAQLEPVRNSDLVLRAEGIAARAAPIYKPDAETPRQRAERRQRVEEALTGVSELYWQASSEQQQVLQDLVDTLQWARDSIDGTATPT